MKKEKLHILAVDDEALNLEIIQHSLTRHGYDVTCADNGSAALALLNESPERYHILLLDRMMPVMDGMEVLERIKESPNLGHPVVILQTAASNRDQISEGMKAGAYYYLSKPYSKEILLKVVEAAAAHIERCDTIASPEKSEAGMLKQTERCEFEIKTPAEAELTALYLANLCPYPDAALPGIRALLLNAIEHGNLGIGYRRKGELLRGGAMDAEVERLLQLPENAGKKVRIVFEKMPSEAAIVIKDEGSGFDWKKYTAIDPTRTAESYGKGIAITGMQCFDRLEYSESGSEVRGVFLIPSGEQQKKSDCATSPRLGQKSKSASNQW